MEGRPAVGTVRVCQSGPSIEQLGDFRHLALVDRTQKSGQILIVGLDDREER